MQTSYVTANGYAEVVLDEGITPEQHYGVDFMPTSWKTLDGECLDELVHVWKYSKQTLPSLGRKYPPAEAVTDHAIQMSRDQSPSRLIAHYIRPHFPYTEEAVSEGRAELYEHELQPYEYLKNGGDRSKVWNAYIDSLRHVLNEVRNLLNNVNADNAVITADHGDAFGEYGGIGHPAGSLNPVVRKVPWVETTGVDSEDRSPAIARDKNDDSTTPTVEDHLESLGYKM